MSAQHQQAVGAANVLCPGLYEKLRRNFAGGVTLSNAGERMHYSTSAMHGVWKTTIHSSGEYYCVNCPFCRDTRHRLWVNHMYGQLDANGKPMCHLATCYNEDCLSRSENWLKLRDVLIGFKNHANRHVPAFALNLKAVAAASYVSQAVELPGELIPMTQLATAMPSHPAVQYLYSRRYTQQMMQKYGISYCTVASRNFPLAQDRIIFPIYMNAELVGWQARYLGTDSNPKIPKYYTMPGMKKRLVLYNYDNAKTQPMVVISEGVTDVHVIGDAGVAIFGKRLSDVQISLLIQTWGGKPIIFLLDPDADDVADKTQRDIERLQHAGQIVLSARVADGYDPGDYDPSALWNIIRAQARDRGVVLPL